MGGPNAIHLSLIFKTNFFGAVRVEPTSRRSADKLLFRSNHRGVNVKSSLVFIEKAELHFLVFKFKTKVGDKDNRNRIA